MPKTLIRERLIPYRILIHLAYGDYPWLSWDGEFAQIQVTPASQHFRLTINRFRLQLLWLESMGYLTALKLEPGLACLSLLPPRNISPCAAQQ